MNLCLSVFRIHILELTRDIFHTHNVLTGCRSWLQSYLSTYILPGPLAFSRRQIYVRVYETGKLVHGFDYTVAECLKPVRNVAVQIFPVAIFYRGANVKH